MKKSILLLSFFLLISLAAADKIYAVPDMFFDLGGTITDIGESEQMKFGGNIAYAVALTKSFDLNFTFRYNFALKPRDIEDKNSASLQYMHWLGGVEYVHPIANRFSVRGAAVFGYANISSSVKFTDGASKDDNDGGLGAGIYAGGIYDITQHMSVFADFGYVYTRYNETFYGSMAHNFQTVIGLRISAFNTRRIDDKY